MVTTKRTHGNYKEKEELCCIKAWQWRIGETGMKRD
jgi:hypothetical protein